MPLQPRTLLQTHSETQRTQLVTHMPSHQPASSMQQGQIVELNIKVFPAQTTISCEELGIH